KTGPSYGVIAAGCDGVLIADGAPPPDGATNGTLPSTARLTAFSRAAGPPGPLSGAPEFPGTLSVQTVTLGRTGGSAQILFDKDGTYSFDADAQDGTALVLASTTKGPQLLSVDLASGAAKPVAWPSGYPATGTWIANPTVLVVVAN